jgi:hypothetical protein
MTRLPELERQLFEAAQALERPRRRWWRIGLLGGGTTLLVAATAAGAINLLLPEGEPVPQAPAQQRASLPDMDPGTSRLVSLRVPDPEGGPPWGFAVARSKDGQTFCLQAGRVQNNQLGVIGRDETFNNDGRFHPLGVDANQSSDCGGVAPGGDLRVHHDEPPIPASGFTGSFLSPAGGCRENVPESTMSPETRRQLRDVPKCKLSSLRIVKYGLAGPDAAKVEYGGHTLRPDPDQSGAYLFVLRPTHKKPTLRITLNDGYVCQFNLAAGFPSNPRDPSSGSPDSDSASDRKKRLMQLAKMREAITRGCPLSP